TRAGGPPNPSARGPTRSGGPAAPPPPPAGRPEAARPPGCQHGPAPAALRRSRRGGEDRSGTTAAELAWHSSWCSSFVTSFRTWNPDRGRFLRDPIPHPESPSLYRFREREFVQQRLFTMLASI